MYQEQANDPDDDHAGDHEIVAIAGVPRINDQEPESGIDRDHLGGYYHQPGDTQRDPQADDELRDHGGI